MTIPPIDDGGPAFPGGDGQYAGNPQYYTPGMTLRDYFAALAMQGMLAADISRKYDETRPTWENPADVASEAYAVADAMLAARKGGAA